MALTLRILVADGPDSQLSLSLDAPRVVIGRSRGCEVLLPDPTVSQRHATIEQRGGKNVITDEGSTNGIVVGLDRLPARTPQTLGPDEIVRVGRLWLQVQAGLGQPGEPKQARAVARRLVSRRLAADGEAANPVIEVLEGPDAGASLELSDPEREYVVGRSKETDLCLGNDGRLSRRHLSVSARGDGWLVRDLGSKRGAELGDEPLTTAGALWVDGGRVSLGETVLELRDPVAEALSEILGAPDERMRPAEFEERPPGGGTKPARRSADELADPEEADPEDLESLPPADGGEDELFVDDEPRRLFDEGDEGEDDAPDSALDAGPHVWLETVVVLVALAVLGASVAGLVWLLGGS